MWFVWKVLPDGVKKALATWANAAPTKGGRMELGEKGRDLIKKWEGLYLKKYLCPTGHWTIGWGHLWKPGDPEEIDEDQAEVYLDQDVVESEVAVNTYVKVPLTQNQFDALVSFTMNLGSGALSSSTLLRLLNQKDYDGAAKQFGRWVYGQVNGQYVQLPGLISRRKEEKELFTEV